MTNASGETRSCPTRDDGAEVLIAHTIALPACQTRQRAMYHKCFQCVYRNASGPPAPVVELPHVARRAVAHEAASDAEPRRLVAG